MLLRQAAQRHDMRLALSIVLIGIMRGMLRRALLRSVAV